MGQTMPHTYDKVKQTGEACSALYLQRIENGITELKKKNWSLVKCSICARRAAVL
jgi:hypothetical protein